MSKLYWLQADNTIIEFTLQPGRNLIGRGGSCDIRIKHPGVSTEHAAIELQANGQANVQDLGSTNGTRVNGHRLDAAHTLRHGDHIIVGREKLIFYADVETTLTPILPALNPASVEVAPSGETVNTDSLAPPESGSDGGSSGVTARILQPEQPVVHPLMAHLTILSGPGSGKRYPLDQPSTTIGKEGRHVIEFVRVSGTRWQLQQKEGIQPAYVNGDALTQPRTLASGDQIEMSGVRMKFEISLQAS